VGRKENVSRLNHFQRKFSRVREYTRETAKSNSYNRELCQFPEDDGEL
jgi:hypothetical protein